MQVDPLAREVAQREFLLHRLVNDYAYHKFTRPAAYKLIEAHRGASRDETVEPIFSEAQSFVREDLGRFLRTYFEEQFLHKRFFAGTDQYEFTGMQETKIFLPWPRAYEVRLEFRLQTERVEEG